MHCVAVEIKLKTKEGFGPSDNRSLDLTTGTKHGVNTTKLVKQKNKLLSLSVNWKKKLKHIYFLNATKLLNVSMISSLNVAFMYRGK